MVKYSQRAILVLLFVIAITILYYASLINYDTVALLSTLFMIVLFVYNHFFDLKTNSFFVKVFGVFIGAGLLSNVFILTEQKFTVLTLISNIVLSIGFLILLLQLINNVKFKQIFGKYSIVVLASFGVTSYFIYKIIMLIVNYDLDKYHVVSFSVTILKLILFCAGIIYYLGKVKASEIKPVLAASLGFFFLQELASLTQLIVFPTKAVVALSILEAGFFLFAVVLLYSYCSRVKK